MHRIKAERYAQIGCLLLIMMIGMILRFGTAALTQVDHPIRNDAKVYVAYAWNLKYLGVYSNDFSTLIGTSTHPTPDAASPPGYPLLLDLVLPKYIDGSLSYHVAYMQAWIATLTLLCTAWLAMELLGPWMGLMAGGLIALSPHQSIYVSYLLTETYFGTVVILALGAGWMALKSDRSRLKLAWACFAGMLFALCCLIRPTLNQWPFALLLLLLWPPVRCFRREIVALVLGFILVMSPWWIRNELSLHRISDSTRMIVTVRDGSYPDFMYEGRPETFGYPYRFDPGAHEAISSWTGLFQDLRVKFERRPVAMVRWYLFGKVVYFFRWSPPDGWGDMFTYPVARSPWLTEPAFRLVTSIMRWLYVPLIVAGVLGTLLAFSPRTKMLFEGVRTQGIRLLALLHLFAICVHVVGAPFARYSVPFRPVTFLLAIFAVVWIYRNVALEHVRSTSDASYG